MRELMSIRRYAAHRRALGLRGGTRAGVQKAIRTGRIDVDADGRISAEEADQQWERRTRRALTFDEVEELVFGDGLEQMTDAMCAELEKLPT